MYSTSILITGEGAGWTGAYSVLENAAFSTRCISNCGKEEYLSDLDILLGSVNLYLINTLRFWLESADELTLHLSRDWYMKFQCS